METYIVREGDTMTSIALQHRLSLEALETANPDVNANEIRPGQRLNLPSGPQAGVSTYTAKQGDTLAGIADHHGLTLDALKAANPHAPNFDEIQPGDQFRIPQPAARHQHAPEGPREPSIYTVQRGDTMASIATRHGVQLSALLAENPNIKDPNKVF